MHGQLASSLLPPLPAALTSSRSLIAKRVDLAAAPYRPATAIAEKALTQAVLLWPNVWTPQLHPSVKGCSLQGSRPLIGGIYEDGHYTTRCVTVGNGRLIGPLLVSTVTVTPLTANRYCTPQPRPRL